MDTFSRLKWGGKSDQRSCNLALGHPPDIGYSWGKVCSTCSWAEFTPVYVSLLSPSYCGTSWPRGYKTFFMLNSVEHEILNSHRYKNIKEFSFF